MALRVERGGACGRHLLLAACGLPYMAQCGVVPPLRQALSFRRRAASDRRACAAWARNTFTGSTAAPCAPRIWSSRSWVGGGRSGGSDSGCCCCCCCASAVAVGRPLRCDRHRGAPATRGEAVAVQGPRSLRRRWPRMMPQASRMEHPPAARPRGERRTGSSPPKDAAAVPSDAAVTWHLQ